MLTTKWWFISTQTVKDVQKHVVFSIIALTSCQCLSFLSPFCFLNVSKLFTEAVYTDFITLKYESIDCFIY